MKARIVLIDNLDSFAYNLVDELRQLGYELTIYRNTVPVEVIQAALENYAGPQLVCLSPGPGHPLAAGSMLKLIDYCAGRIPMLGICLGFQALLHSAGARIDRCEETVHGKIASISCKPHAIFDGLPSPLPVARYHSLSGYDLPEHIDQLAHFDSIPMAAWLPQQLAIGFQFHPESVMTTFGTQLLQQSVDFLFQQTAAFDSRKQQEIARS